MSTPISNKPTSEPDLQAKTRKRRATLSKSLGRLPRLSKELMYDSIKNQPLPRPPPSEPLQISPTPVEPSTHSQTFTRPLRLRRSASFKDNVSSGTTPFETSTPDYQRESMAASSETTPQPSSLDEILKFGTGRKYFRSSISGPTGPVAEDFGSVHGKERPRRRGSLYDALSLPSMFGGSKLKNKRDSAATTSTQGEEPPSTPDTLSYDHADYLHLSGSDYGLPTDPFGPNLARIQEISNLRASGGASHIPQDYNELEKLDSSDNDEWNVSTPKGRTAEYEVVPRWVYASRSASPVQETLTASLEQASPPPEQVDFLPCMGLEFPMPPRSRTASNENNSRPSVSLLTLRPGHSASFSLDANTTCRPSLRRSSRPVTLDYSVEPSETRARVIVSGDRDEYKLPPDRFNAISGRKRRQRHSIHGAFETPTGLAFSSSYLSPLTATDYCPSAEVPNDVFNFGSFVPPEISLADEAVGAYGQAFGTLAKGNGRQKRMSASRSIGRECNPQSHH